MPHDQIAVLRLPSIVTPRSLAEFTEILDALNSRLAAGVKLKEMKQVNTSCDGDSNGFLVLHMETDETIEVALKLKEK